MARHPDQKRQARTNRPRLFVGCPVPGGIKKNVAALTPMLRESLGDSLRLADLGQLHITLKFLGEQHLSVVAELARMIALAAEPFGQFALSLQGLGVFPRPERAKVLWAGVDGDTEPLMEMHAALDLECAEFGVRREPKGYRPHVTLARLRPPPEASAMQGLLDRTQSLDIGKLTVREIVVYTSTFTGSHHVYDPVHTHRLA